MLGGDPKRKIQGTNYTKGTNKQPNNTNSQFHETLAAKLPRKSLAKRMTYS